MFRIIIHIILLAVVVAFVALNVSYTTSVNFFTYMFEDVSTVAVVLVAFILGIIYSFLIYVQNYFYQSGRKREKERRDKTKTKEKELKTKEKKITAQPPAPKPTSKKAEESGVTVQQKDAKADTKKNKKPLLPFGNKSGKDNKQEP